MLRNIHVKNLALIDDSYVTFGDGLNVLSGETGAGKSLLIRSVELLLGKKADKSLIRKGADNAYVEIEFDNVPESVLEFLEQEAIEVSDTLILSRKITENKTISRINGESVSLKTMSYISSMLMSLCGQQAVYEFRDEEYHLKLIDRFAGEMLSPFIDNVNIDHDYLIESQKRYESLKKRSASPEYSRDFIEYEVNELESSDIKEGELESLEKRYKIMSQSEELMQNAAGILRMFDSDPGISGMISDAASRFSSYDGLDDTIDSINENLMNMESLSFDTIRMIDRYLDSLDFDEAEKAETEERLNELNRLMSKYSTDEKGLISLLEKKRNQLDEIDNIKTYLEEAKKDYERSLEKYNCSASVLTKERKKYAAVFIDKIKAELAELDFDSVDMDVVFETKKDPSPNGMDEAFFMVSFNAGEPLRPLNDVASGGELSRIMLSVMSALGNKDMIPTIIFDEIDSGISGHAAARVAKKLMKISQDHQLLCITHLGQIVSCADNNYKIYKSSDGDSTTTKVICLDEDGVIEEIARILGGDVRSDTVYNAAVELRKSSRTD